ncbi:MAG: transcriptional regulator [Desulfobacterales bacterium]|nr:transcriptional regulator [Desulfobacterales bacterium]
MLTIRQQIIAQLEEGEMDVRAVSKSLGIREKDVYDHLLHISRSLANQERKIRITPHRCLSCGFEFKERKRFQRPGRCPKCKKGHLEPALYRIETP